MEGVGWTVSEESGRGIVHSSAPLDEGGRSVVPPQPRTRGEKGLGRPEGRGSVTAQAPSRTILQARWVEEEVGGGLLRRHVAKESKVKVNKQISIHAALDLLMKQT